MKLEGAFTERLPTAADVAFYREHGWWVADCVFTGAEIDEALRGAERHWAGERDWPLAIADGYKDWKPGDGAAMRLNEFVAVQNREIRRLIEKPLLGAIAARLAGTDQVRLWESELVMKPPQRVAPNAAIGWHTDRAYWMTCASTNLVTAWIPFHDCPAEMGPLTVVDGSHLWPDLDHDQLRQFLNSDLDGRESRLLGGRTARKIPLALKKGQVSFHSCLLLHSSGFNVSDRPRITLAVHLQDRANRYRKYWNEKGELWSIAPDRLCRKTAEGEPDYADPAICPLLWSDDWLDPRDRYGAVGSKGSRATA